jgi:hypothetical protein
MFELVEFHSEGATLRGRLYLQPGRSEPAPIVIMAHGFTATINGMVAERYAEVFCEAGFAVLLYDHRNLGMSEGEPRQQINRWIQARGYRDAIDYVSTLPAIDASRIAIWYDPASVDSIMPLADWLQLVKVPFFRSRLQKDYLARKPAYRAEFINTIHSLGKTGPFWQVGWSAMPQHINFELKGRIGRFWYETKRRLSLWPH